MAKVTIDKETCVGCGLCEQNCADVFEVKDDSLAYVKTPDCSSCNLSEVAEQCPVSAIKIEG
ncbi:MAG: ferredoxin [Candidatus Omnitrophota bacterium]